MSHVFEVNDDRAARDFHVAVHQALKPILDTIETQQLYRDDEFALVVKRGFGQIVKWVETRYGASTNKR